VNEAFDSLAGRRVVLIGGKGGVGKTTVAIAAALHFRDAVLFTTDPASNLSDILHGEVRTEALDAASLYRRFLDRNLADFLEIGDRGTYLDKEELRRFFELSLPGVDELMAWMRIGELAEENPASTIVVDTAPTGHTLRMLGAAEHFRQFAAALDSMQAKHREMVRQFTRRSARDAVDAFIADFEATARRRRELLASAGAFVPVFLSEPWVVEQTRRLIESVEMPIPFAILNRVVEPDCDRDRARALRDAEARAALAPLRVIDAPRACVPLDTPERIAKWATTCHPERSEGPGREGLRAARAPRPLATLGVTRVLFFAGKGGVGKTTCSASVALQLARREKVTLLSVDPAHSVRDVFANQAPPENLTVETIDTRAKWRQFRDALGEEIERAVGALAPSGLSVAHDTEAMRKLIEIAPPGADELFAITRLADLIADGNNVVVDTAPTGHFLRLIDLPKTAGEWVHEFMRILLRYRELIPPGTLGEELLRASRALHSVEETLKSERCRIVVVTRPERVVIAETKRLLGEIAQRGMHAGGVIANYVTPESDCPCDRSMRGYELEALAALGPVVTIEQRDEPVVALDELARLVPLDSAR
jgi:arsenite/tail-anchored protein-transporting ATPase